MNSGEFLDLDTLSIADICRELYQHVKAVQWIKGFASTEHRFIHTNCKQGLLKIHLRLAEDTESQERRFHVIADCKLEPAWDENHRMIADVLDFASIPLTLHDEDIMR